MQKNKSICMRNRMMLIAALLLCSTGCALFLIGTGATIGVGTVAYVDGEFRAADSVRFESACGAVDQALDDLQLKKINSSRDKLTMQVTARTADDRRVEIIVRRQTETETAFRIRVGTFGDEVLSRAIYEKIKSHF